MRSVEPLLLMMNELLLEEVESLPSSFESSKVTAEVRKLTARLGDELVDSNGLGPELGRGLESEHGHERRVPGLVDFERHVDYDCRQLLGWTETE